MDSPADTRLVDLEIRYTHLERQVDELNGVVVAQQRTIDELRKRLTALGERVAALGEDPALGAQERPPHY